MSGFVHIGVGIHRFKDRREAIRPIGDARLFGNQILPHLDQRVGKPRNDTMLEHGVVAQRSVIGLIVADDQLRVGAQALEQWQHRARIAVPQYARMPGARRGLPEGGEGMDRDDQRRLAACRADRCDRLRDRAGDKGDKIR